MILQAIDMGWVGVLTDVISFIFEVLAPILVPIGQVMVLWIEVLLPYFPTGTYALNDLSIYVIIFIFLIVGGGFINSYFPGDKAKEGEEKELDENFLRLTQALDLKEWKEKKFDEKSKESLETFIPKAEEIKEIKEPIEEPKEEPIEEPKEEPSES